MRKVGWLVRDLGEHSGPGYWREGEDWHLSSAASSCSSRFRDLTRE